MKLTKKLVSMFLVLCMVLAMLPTVALSASAADGTWDLVTDASTLKTGDQIVIVANGYDYALSTTQNKNNRGQASVTKDTTNNTVTLGTDVQVLTLEAGTISGSFAFNTGSGYLYAASTSENYLRTGNTKTANSSWTISITSEGVATVIAQGTNSRNWLRYNSSNEIFSCYGSGQKDISIYKRNSGSSGGETTTNYTVTYYSDSTTVLGEPVKYEESATIQQGEVPTATTSVPGYVFAGWATAPVAAVGSYSSLITNEDLEGITVDKNLTYYAVYVKTAPDGMAYLQLKGKQIFVSAWDGVNGYLCATNSLANAYPFAAPVSDGNYVLYSQDTNGKKTYVAKSSTADASDLMFYENIEPAVYWEWTVADDGTITIKAVSYTSSGNIYLAYDEEIRGFAAYTGDKETHPYEYLATPTIYTSDPVTPPPSPAATL